MKICIPSENDQGLASPVSEHFGQAPSFCIVDLETGKLHLGANPRRAKHPGRCSHVPILQAHAVDTVVVRSLGHRARESFQAGGLRILTAPRTTVDQVVQAMRRGESCHWTTAVGGSRHTRCRHGRSGMGHARKQTARAGRKKTAQSR